SGGGSFSTDSRITLGEFASGKGTYTLNGGSAQLLAAGITVGASGAGTFNQSDGGATISGTGSFLTVARDTNSTGIYTLSGGILENEGGESIGNGGAGTFVQSGGFHSITNGQSLG